MSFWHPKRAVPRLSDLEIDVDKDWLGYIIKNLGGIQIPRTNDPATLLEGLMWYRKDTDEWKYSPDGTNIKLLSRKLKIHEIFCDDKKQPSSGSISECNYYTDYSVSITPVSGSALAFVTLRVWEINWRVTIEIVADGSVVKSVSSTGTHRWSGTITSSLTVRRHANSTVSWSTYLGYWNYRIAVLILELY